MTWSVGVHRLTGLVHALLIVAPRSSPDPPSARISPGVAMPSAISATHLFRRPPHERSHRVLSAPELLAGFAPLRSLLPPALHRRPLAGAPAVSPARPRTDTPPHPYPPPPQPTPHLPQQPSGPAWASGPARAPDYRGRHRQVHPRAARHRSLPRAPARPPRPQLASPAPPPLPGVTLATTSPAHSPAKTRGATGACWASAFPSRRDTTAPVVASPSALSSRSASRPSERRCCLTATPRRPRCRLRVRLHASQPPPTFTRCGSTIERA